jgi:hypothetical protein
MKDYIVERLLTEGHITIEMADLILNNKQGKTQIISDLATNGNITKLEAVTLLKEKQTESFPGFGTPNQTLPWVQPISLPYVDWSTPGTIPNQPRWTVTCSTDNDLNNNHSSK